MADNVTGVAFEYLDAAMAPMPLARVLGRPIRGAGPTAFDADLLRVRTVRATLRLETGVDNMRGTDPRFFARPGTATGAPHHPRHRVTHRGGAAERRQLRWSAPVRPFAANAVRRCCWR